MGTRTRCPQEQHWAYAPRQAWLEAAAAAAAAAAQQKGTAGQVQTTCPFAVHIGLACRPALTS